MGFILIMIVIIAALLMFSGNKTKKSAKAIQEQKKFQRKMEMEFNTGIEESSSQAYHVEIESSSQAYHVDLAKSWSAEQVKEYS